MALILCPKCRNQFQGPPGARVKCPHCGTQLETPTSQQQIKQKKQETQKRQKVVTMVVLALFLLTAAYFIWDSVTFTKDEYETKYAEILEEIDQYEDDLDKAGYEKASAELDYALADTEAERDRAYEKIREAEWSYTIKQDLIDARYRQLGRLQEEYESGIWYKLFG